MTPNGSKFYEHLDPCDSADEIDVVLETDNVESPPVREEPPKRARNRLVKPAPRDLHADHGSERSAPSSGAKMVRDWWKQHVAVDVGLGVSMKTSISVASLRRFSVPAAV